MAEFALVDYFIMGEAIGIVATLVVSFYYSRKQMTIIFQLIYFSESLSIFKGFERMNETKSNDLHSMLDN